MNVQDFLLHRYHLVDNILERTEFRFNKTHFSILKNLSYNEVLVFFGKVQSIPSHKTIIITRKQSFNYRGFTNRSLGNQKKGVFI